MLKYLLSILLAIPVASWVPDRLLISSTRIRNGHVSAYSKLERCQREHGGLRRLLKCMGK